MTSDAASQNSPPPPSSPPQGQPPADPEAGRIKNLDERFGAIETEQKEQRGILSRIEQALTGGHPKEGGTPPSASGATGPPPAGQSIAEQVRQGVEQIEAKKRKDAADKQASDADQAWRKNVDDHLAEHRPAEPRTGRKARLQRALFGRGDER